MLASEIPFYWKRSVCDDQMASVPFFCVQDFIVMPYSHI